MSKGQRDAKGNMRAGGRDTFCSVMTNTGRKRCCGRNLEHKKTLICDRLAASSEAFAYAVGES
jgi:hypothetical protein